MRRLLRWAPVALVVAVLAGVPALAGMPAYWSETQALTRAAPTDASEGLYLGNISGFRVIVSAEAGQTLSGAGTLRAYLYEPVIGRWVRNPSLDISLSAAGVRDVTSPDFQTVVRGGRVFFAADSVTVSGGSTITVRIDAWSI